MSSGVVIVIWLFVMATTWLSEPPPLPQSWVEASNFHPRMACWAARSSAPMMASGLPRDSAMALPVDAGQRVDLTRGDLEPRQARRLLVPLRVGERVGDPLRRAVAHRGVQEDREIELLAYEGVARHAERQLVVDLILRPDFAEKC